MPNKLLKDIRKQLNFELEGSSFDKNYVYQMSKVMRILDSKIKIEVETKEEALKILEMNTKLAEEIVVSGNQLKLCSKNKISDSKIRENDVIKVRKKIISEIRACLRSLNNENIKAIIDKLINLELIGIHHEVTAHREISGVTKDKGGHIKMKTIENSLKGDLRNFLMMEKPSKTEKSKIKRKTEKFLKELKEYGIDHSENSSQVRGEAHYKKKFLEAVVKAWISLTGEECRSSYGASGQPYARFLDDIALILYPDLKLESSQKLSNEIAQKLISV